MDQRSTFRVAPEALLTELGDGTGVLLHLGTKFYFTLNGTGVRVWRTLAGSAGVTIGRLADDLSSSYAVTPEAARADLEPLLAELVAEGLVVSA